MPTGTAIWSAATGSIETVQVPNCTADDIQRFASMVDGFTSGSIDGSMTIDYTPSETKMEPEPEPLNIRAIQVRDLLKQQVSQNEIIRTVWKIEGKGRAYQNAAAELREIVASLI